jgi:hypothetical protein
MVVPLQERARGLCFPPYGDMVWVSDVIRLGLGPAWLSSFGVNYLLLLLLLGGLCFGVLVSGNREYGCR